MKRNDILQEKETKDVSENDLNILMFHPEKIEKAHNEVVAELNMEQLLLKLKTILGYKIVLLKDNTLLFKSVYAYTDDDVFCIRITKNNMLQFIKTSYLQEWQNEYEKYVLRGKSICAFLSAVNLELFSRNTIDGCNK